MSKIVEMELFYSNQTNNMHSTVAIAIIPRPARINVTSRQWIYESLAS